MNSQKFLDQFYTLINQNTILKLINNKIRIFIKKNISLDKKKEILEFIKKNDFFVKKLLALNGDLINSKTQIFRFIDKKNFLSFAQERLWFIEKYGEGTNIYNIPMIFQLSREASFHILEKSLKEIITRHEILRTLIKEDEEGNGYQLVVDVEEKSLEISRIKINNYSEIEEEFSKEVNHIYNISDEYPIRLCFYETVNEETKESERYLSIVVHHIAFDGWSIDILLRELEEYYRYYLDLEHGLEAKLSLPELSIQYKDFALWQRSYLSGERLDKQLNYWKTKLAGYETLNLITDKLRPSEIEYVGRAVYFELDEYISTKLRDLAKELKVSLYSVLLAGYYLMLKVYSNQDDIIIGSPIANRHYTQVENLIGFFINSLGLRVKIEPKKLVEILLKKLVTK